MTTHEVWIYVLKNVALPGFLPFVKWVYHHKKNVINKEYNGSYCLYFKNQYKKLKR